MLAVPMRYARHVAGMVLLLLAPCVNAGAQRTEAEPGPAGLVGLRVRLQLRQPVTPPDTVRAPRSVQTLLGIVRHATEDSVVIDGEPPATGAHPLAWSQVHRMHVRRARAASASRTLGNVANAGIGGAIFGAAVGALGGLALAQLDLDLGGTARLVGQGATVGGGTGLVIGSVVGFTWSRGVWVRVPLPRERR